VDVGSGGVSVGAPVQRIHQAYDDGSYILCARAAPAPPLARCCAPPAAHGDSRAPDRVVFNVQPVASDKYNDPCACADDGAGALATRAAGYGLGSLGGDERAAPGRPEPLLPYGGLDKYAPPPSPLKAPRVRAARRRRPHGRRASAGTRARGRADDGRARGAGAGHAGRVAARAQGDRRRRARRGRAHSGAVPVPAAADGRRRGRARRGRAGRADGGD